MSATREDIPESSSVSADGDGPPVPVEPASEQRAKSTVPRRMRRYLALIDFERAARSHLPHMLYSFVAGGAETDASVRDNRAAFQEYAFVPRVLASAASRSTTTTLFGKRYAAPFGIAAMGMGPVVSYRSDLALARAAAATNIPMMLSGASLTALEKVRQVGSTTWFQSYIPGETRRIEALVDRVVAAGYDTFVLTVDVTVPANRENNIRNGFSVPLQPNLKLAWDGLTHPKWLFGTALRTLLTDGMPHLENMEAVRGPPVLSRNLVRAVGAREELSWRHVELIRRRFSGRVIVKGILAKEDARLARESGADGIVVSNHGGRQLDGAISPLRVLPAIAAEAGDMTVMIDSGIRRGSDVLKALALGAKFVFIGRPFMYAAAVGGEPAAARLIQLMSEEIDRNMAMLGIRDIASMRADLVTRIGAGSPA
jgi:L-lactate dehydrogenase (cytochrome)